MPKGIRQAYLVLRDFKPYLQTLGAIGVRALGSLVLQKGVAYVAGAAGVAYLAHVQNLFSLITAPASDGLARGMIAQASGVEGEGNKSPIYQYGLRVIVLATTVLGFCFFGAGYWVSPEVFAGKGFVAYTNFLLACPALGLQIWLLAFLQAERALRKLLIYTVLSVSIGLASAYGAYVAGWGLLAMLSVNFLSQGGMAIFWIARDRLRAFGRFKISIVGLRSYLPYLTIAAGVALAGRAADFGVRELAFHHFNAEQVGYWQAAARLGDLLAIPFTAISSTVFYPRFASLSNKTLYVERVTLAFGAAAALSVGLLALLSPIVLVIVNTMAFKVAAPLYKVQALGDVFRIASLLPSLWLAAQGRARAILLLEALSLCSYLGCIWAGMQFVYADSPLLALPAAHVVRYVIFFVATYWVAVRTSKPGDR